MFDPNAPRNSLGVRFDADRYGLDTQTALSRDQWAVYYQNFAPAEDSLIQWASDIYKPQESADRAAGYVDQAFNAQAGAAERRRRAYGITLTPDEQTAVTRRQGLQESLSKVQAANQSREATADQQRAISGIAGAGL